MPLVFEPPSEVIGHTQPGVRVGARGELPLQLVELLPHLGLRAPVVTLEGNFSLGWLVRLTTAQLEFVGLFLTHRGNLQKLAPELGVSYNTARSRLDNIVTALGGMGERPKAASLEVLSALNDGELDFEEAKRRLKLP